jgi:uncharacterized protein (TIGR03083 family)
MTQLDDPVATYEAAARSFAQLVHRIPGDRWDGPGLGEWDLRSLVGHTSRSLTTVIAYLPSTAEREDISSAVDYYTRTREAARAPGVAERGRQAGIDLGADPASAVDALVERVLGDLAGSDDRLIRVIGGLGMRLYAYLPTRTFELAVHSLDIAAAVDISFTPPAEVLEQATVLAARVATALGEGPTVLRALTGRTPLDPGFSIV